MKGRRLTERNEQSRAALSVSQSPVCDTRPPKPSGGAVRRWFFGSREAEPDQVEVGLYHFIAAKTGVEKGKPHPHRYSGTGHEY